MAEPTIILADPPSHPGNGAREALIDIASGGPVGWVDLLLTELWCRGYGIAPLDQPQQART